MQPFEVHLPNLCVESTAKIINISENAINTLPSSARSSMKRTGTLETGTSYSISRMGPEVRKRTQRKQHVNLGLFFYLFVFLFNTFFLVFLSFSVAIVISQRLTFISEKVRQGFIYICKILFASCFSFFGFLWTQGYCFLTPHQICIQICMIIHFSKKLKDNNGYAVCSHSRSVVTARITAAKETIAYIVCMCVCVQPAKRGGEGRKKKNATPATQAMCCGQW